MVEILEN